MPYIYHKKHGVHFTLTDNETEDCKKNDWIVLDNYEKWHKEQIAKKLGKFDEKVEKTLDNQEIQVIIPIQAEPQKRSPGRPKK